MILEESIRQSRFENEYIRAVLNLYHTHAEIQGYAHAILRPFGISVQQYNILRILRGQNGNAVSIGEITCRMLDKMSNTSRLIEKLRAKGFLLRKECPIDRRRAEVELTTKGLALINESSRVLDEALIRRMGVLSSDEIIMLNRILDRLNQ
jgi:DNA-binding MarR family transcriptional regulator